jgi:hypothetical protein
LTEEFDLMFGDLMLEGLVFFYKFSSCDFPCLLSTESTVGHGRGGSFGGFVLVLPL